MFQISKKSRSFINILGIPTILISISNQSIYFIMVLIILCFCSIEYVKVVSKLGGKLNIPLILTLNLLFFGNSVTNYIDNLKYINHIDILVLIFFIILFNEIIFNNNARIRNVAYYFIGVIWIGYCLSSTLIYIRYFEYGLYFTLMLFISVWVCDTFAFIAGSKFGKKKILPAISPNKTYVGCIAGLLGSMLMVLIFNVYQVNYIENINLGLLDLFVLSLIFGVIGQIGDFTESIIKREANIKDTGDILMGHGGFLDRFDSISLAAPALYIYMKIFIL